MLKNVSHIKRVVLAIFIRELKTRFGKYRLGYLWAILEPLSIIALFVFIRGILAGSLRVATEKIIYHVDYPLFLAAGVIPFFLFKNAAIQIMNSIEANRGLFYYQPVKPIDAMISRWLLEGIIFSIVGFVIFFMLAMLGFSSEIRNPLGLLLIILLFYIFSFAVGLVLCIAVNIIEELRNVVSPVMLFLFFTSGIFFSINMIPQKFRIFLLWNPIIHFIELIRLNFFPLYRADDVSLHYVIIWTIAILWLGLALYKLKIREVLLE